MSSRSKRSYAKRETMMEEMFASSDAIDLALRTITEKWRLFRWSQGDGAYLQVREPGETSRMFRDRVQRTVHHAVGIAWILRDLLEGVSEDGIVFSRGSAPHSNEEFAEQLGCHPMAASRELDRVLKIGYFKRYNRKGNKPLYARFDDGINDFLFFKYKEDYRTIDASGVNPYIEPSDRPPVKKPRKQG